VRRERMLPYAYLSPAMVLISVILLYPVISGLLLSLFNRDAYNPSPSFVGLKNYLLLAKDTTFLLSLWHTLWWALSVLFGQYVLGLALALLLNKRIRGRAVFRAIILTPWVIPPALAAITWKWIYEEQYGILNSILMFLGILRTRVAWLGTDRTAMWALIAAGIWQGIPFVAIVLLAGLQAIPLEEYEAAKIDGANAWQCFRFLTMPHLTGISFIVIILSTIWNINQFELVYILTRGGPGNATQVLSTYTYQLFFSAFQFSTAATVATVMLIILMVLTGFYIRRIIYPR